MKKTILIVEDDEAIIESMCYVLEEAKFKVIQVENSKEMDKQLKHNNIDLVLLDYWLPLKNGGEIIRDLRSSKKTENLPVIVISASQNIKDEVMKKGANDFLAKPFDIEELVSIVSKHLDKQKI